SAASQHGTQGRGSTAQNRDQTRRRTMSNANERSEERRQPARVRTIRPPVDVFEDDERITLYADLPGVSQDQLDVSVHGKVLTIEGSASISTPKDMKVAYAEFRTPHYLREFTLSGELDTTGIDASLNN